MQDYRIYELDPRGGIVGPACIVTARDDRAAIGEAPLLAELAFGGELWLADRLVARLPPRLKHRMWRLSEAA